MCAAPDEGSSVPAADEGASVPLSGTEENTVSSDSDSDCNHVQQASWPSHWTLQQKQYFVTEYPWLYESDGKLGCTKCRDVSQTAGPQGRGGRRGGGEGGEGGGNGTGKGGEGSPHFLLTTLTTGHTHSLQQDAANN